MQIEFIFVIAVLIYSAILHEIAHGYAALFFGDITAKVAGRLSLNPIRHIDPVGSLFLPFILFLLQSPFLIGYAKPVPYNPYNLTNRKLGEVAVASAGIVTNLLLAILFGLVLRFFSSSFSDSIVQIMTLIVYMNVMLAIFNLIPVPGFDGAKLFRSILPFGLSHAYERLENSFTRYGMVGPLVLIFILLFILGPILGGAVFFLSSLFTGYSQVEMSIILSAFF